MTQLQLIKKLQKEFPGCRLSAEHTIRYDQADRVKLSRTYWVYIFSTHGSDCFSSNHSWQRMHDKIVNQKTRVLKNLEGGHE